MAILDRLFTSWKTIKQLTIENAKIKDELVQYKKELKLKEFYLYEANKKLEKIPDNN